MAKAVKKSTVKVKGTKKTAKTAQSKTPKAKAAAAKKAAAKPARKPAAKTVKKAVKKPVKAAIAKSKTAKPKAPKSKAVKPKVVARKAAAKTSARKPSNSAVKARAKKAVQKPSKRAPAISSKRAVFSAPPAQAQAKPEGNRTTPSWKATLQENKMVQNTQQFEQFTQGINSFGRENAEAFIKSSTIFAKGFEDLYRTSLSLAQSAAEKQAQLVKQALSAKTINEFAALQTQVTQSGFDDFMSNATQISEMSVKLLTEASEPINKQLNDSIQKVSKMAA